jgi:hypothetical protein
MGSPDDLDRLLALGSERPERPECVDASAIDEADLLAYRRGVLAEAEQERIERHLVACAFCRDLLANIQVERRQRAPWRMIAGGAAAAIAALVLILATPPPREPIGKYTIVEVRGQIASHRAEPDAEGRVFRPESQVAIKIEPQGGRGATVVRAYRIEEGVLKQLDVSIEAGRAGVFWIKGSGRELFGGEAGPKRLVFLAADPDADLTNVAGRSLASAQALTTQTSWLPLFDADYRIE